MAKTELVLNIAPISFSARTFRAGQIPFRDDDTYTELRERHRATHVFRLDARSGSIVNLALGDGDPLGDVNEVAVDEHLLLLGKAVQHSVSEWLRTRFEVLSLARPIRFFGKASRSRLLARAATDLGLTPHPKLDVVVRYSMNTRIVTHPKPGVMPYLALVLDVSTSNVIDLSVAELLGGGVDVIGKYVCKLAVPEEGAIRPRPEILGIASRIEGDEVILAESEGVGRVSTADAALEPRQENLETVVRSIYGDKAERLLSRVRQLRGPYSSANGKREQLRTTLENLRKHHDFRIGAGLVATVGDLLAIRDDAFPSRIATTRPTILVGPQGRNTSEYPDGGVREFGPYKYMHKRME